MEIFGKIIINTLFGIIPLLLVFKAFTIKMGGGGGKNYSLWRFAGYFVYLSAIYLITFSLIETDPLPEVILRIAYRSAALQIYFPFLYFALIFDCVILAVFFIWLYSSKFRRWIFPVYRRVHLLGKSAIPFYLRTLVAIVVAIGYFLCYSSYDYRKHYNISAEQLHFHLTAGASFFESLRDVWGLLDTVVYRFIMPYFLSGIVIFVGVYLTAKLRLWRDLRLSRRVLLLSSILIAVASGAVFIENVVTFKYFWVWKTITTDANKIRFYARHYLDPRQTEIVFPESKRNLIVLFIESLDTGFLPRELGGGMAENYLPQIVALANENINFSHNSGIGGLTQIHNCGFTQAGTVAYFTGVPFAYSLTRHRAAGIEVDPGEIAVGNMTHNFSALTDILHDAGYQNYLYFRNTKSFAGQGRYFGTHGAPSMMDDADVAAKGYAPPELSGDRRMFAAAQKWLTEIAAQKEPFFFMAYTLDTHADMKSSLEPEAEQKYPRVEENVLADCDKQVADFVAWFREQGFSTNTTLVILGDHRYFDATFFPKDLPPEKRHPLNIFINSALSPDFSKNRKFCHFDFFPTLIEAIGGKINAPGLGLGRSLNSAAPTLMEQLGFSELDDNS